MNRIEVINMIREAISLAGDGADVPYTDEEYDAMYNLLDELENKTPKRSPKRSSDDWRGCQGTCDFEEIPNTTGWI